MRASNLVSVLLVGLGLLAGGCAPHTRPLTEPPPSTRVFDATKPGEATNPSERYYFSSLKPGPRNGNGLFVVLTFSGGGKRAAALSYGVLEQLRNVRIPCAQDEDCPAGTKSLLDEVDVISSVSGGSFTSAYYARYGDAIFDTSGRFRKQFLYFDAERELFGEAVYYPQNWLRIGARPEIAASLWSKLLFDKATYSDLAKRPRPFVILNASDYATQARFQFTQDSFDWLCTDLSAFPLSRAVAASSAFPGLLNSLSLQAHNGAPACTNARPEWLKNAAANKYADRFDYRRALDYEKLTKTDKKYLHLLDGGLVDNLGVRAIYEGLVGAQNASVPLLELLNGDDIHDLLLIVVNARTGDKPARFYQPDRLPIGPLTLPVIGATSSLPMGAVSDDSVDMLSDLVDTWQQRRREELDDCATRKAAGQPCADPVFKANMYAVELTFQNIEAEPERDFFKHLPTDFSLPRSTIDCLAVKGRQLLNAARPYGGGSVETPGGDAPTFQEFVRTHLKGLAPDVREQVVVNGGKCEVEP